jgi:hypothetical protein
MLGAASVMRPGAWEGNTRHGLVVPDHRRANSVCLSADQGGDLSKHEAATDAEVFAALAWISASEAAANTRRLEEEFRHAAYRYNVPIIDLATGAVAGQGLITGIDLQRFDPPEWISFRDVGRCRWSRTRAAYVPWTKPKLRTMPWWEGLSLLGCFFAAWGALAAFFGLPPHPGIGVMLVVYIAGTTLLVSARSIDRHDANTQARAADVSAWTRAEEWGHAPNPTPVRALQLPPGGSELA